MIYDQLWAGFNGVSQSFVGRASDFRSQALSPTGFLGGGGGVGMVGWGVVYQSPSNKEHRVP